MTPLYPRRRFLAGAAATAVGGLAAEAAQDNAPAAADRGPDLAVVNAVVYTIDDRRPRAEAFAVKNGRIVAVGSTADIRTLSTPASRTLDAAGMTIVPGFIDAHCHPASSGLSELLEVDCNLRNIAAIKAALRARAATLQAGEWVFGFKYDDTKLTDGRPLLRSDLDDACPNNPVRVEHRGCHTIVVNSATFRAAGIDRMTPDPEGGRYGRDAAGELTGFVAEKAVERIERASRRAPATPQQRREAVKRMSELMTAAGLTTVHDAMASREDFAAYQDALAAGEMRFRVNLLARPELFRALTEAGIRRGFGGERIRLAGLKLFCDGSASERTMRMSTPYVGRTNDFGILVTTQEALNDAVREAHVAGFQVGIHANGDVAIDMALRAFDLAVRAHPRPDPRHRIEHCTLVNEGLLRRIAEQGVIPTPFYTYIHYHGDKWEQYGEERVRSMFAHRSFLDHGIKVAGASDYVPGPYEPLMAIQSMVTRKDYRGRVWGGNQRITVDEALRICTLHGAHASFEEGLKGTITEGKLADFVMLAEDPHRVDPDRIKDIRVERTVVGGVAVHSR
jgi:predicted amidohydrolase YtcJ